MWSYHNCLVIVTSSEIDWEITSGTKTEWVRHGDNLWRSSFLSSFMDSLCRVRNKIMYVLSWRNRVLFWYSFPLLLRNSGNKHKNNTLVSAETVRHSSTYIILYFQHYIHYPSPSLWFWTPYPQYIYTYISNWNMGIICIYTYQLYGRKCVHICISVCFYVF